MSIFKGLLRLGSHMTTTHSVIIIGSGPAGYTAGLYAARAMMEPLMFAGYMSGGQLMLTSDIENFRVSSRNRRAGNDVGVENTGGEVWIEGARQER